MVSTESLNVPYPKDIVNEKVKQSCEGLKAKITFRDVNRIEGKAAANWKNFGGNFTITLTEEQANHTTIRIEYDYFYDDFIKPLRKALAERLGLELEEKKAEEDSLCIGCKVRKSKIRLPLEDLCNECFEVRFGKIILGHPAGQYYGGHKAYLAGGFLSDYQSGHMYLTDTYLLFLKEDKNPKKRWQIVIPIASIIVDGWTIEEESRRTDIVGGGASVLGGPTMIGAGTIHQSGKAHHIVVPYIDENGIPQQPRFGVSSITGKAIKQWSSALYELISKSRKKAPSDIVSSEMKSNNVDDDPRMILKKRLAKGEITVEDYERMRKMING